MGKGRGTWDERYGKGTFSTKDIPIVGREDKGKVLKALNKNPLKHGILDHIDPGPEPIKGTEAQPYLGTDPEYMARERARAADFEKTFGLKHERKLEETDSLVASDKRIAVTYRTQELPTGDKEKDKKIGKATVVKRVIEVPFGNLHLDTEADIAPVTTRVSVEADENVAEVEEVEVEAQVEEAQKRRLQR